MEMINEVVTVESKGILHQVRVIEEQMVINTFIQSDCSCPGCKIQETLHVDEEEDEDDVDDKDKRKNDVDNEVLQLEGVAETEGSKVEEFVEDSVEMVADSTALNAKSAANTTEIEKQAVTKENTQVHALSNLLVTRYSSQHTKTAWGTGRGQVNVNISNFNLGQQFGPKNKVAHFEIPRSISLNGPIHNNLDHELVRRIVPYNNNRLNNQTKEGETGVQQPNTSNNKQSKEAGVGNKEAGSSKREAEIH